MVLKLFKYYVFKYIMLKFIFKFIKKEVKEVKEKMLIKYVCLKYAYFLLNERSVKKEVENESKN